MWAALYRFRRDMHDRCHWWKPNFQRRKAVDHIDPMGSEHSVFCVWLKVEDCEDRQAVLRFALKEDVMALTLVNTADSHCFLLTLLAAFSIHAEGIVMAVTCAHTNGTCTDFEPSMDLLDGARNESKEHYESHESQWQGRAQRRSRCYG